MASYLLTQLWLSVSSSPKRVKIYSRALSLLWKNNEMVTHNVDKHFTLTEKQLLAKRFAKFA